MDDTRPDEAVGGGLTHGSGNETRTGFLEAMRQYLLNLKTDSTLDPAFLHFLF